MKNFEIAVISPELDIAKAFIGDVSGTKAASGNLVTQGGVATLTATLVTPEGGFDGPGVPVAEAYVLVAHFLDAISLDCLKFAYEAVRARPRAKVVVSLYRLAGEGEYKISCLSCGQKLLIADAHVGRIGRCPHCKESFRLPMPDVLLSNAVGLPSPSDIRKLFGKNPASSHDLAMNLAKQMAGMDQALKGMTMKIEIPKS